MKSGSGRERELARERDEKDRRLFDAIAKNYAKKDILPASVVARRAQVLYALKPLLSDIPFLGVIVDVGCGIGAPALYLRGKYSRYIGIDQSEEMISLAREFHQGNANATFLHAAIDDASLPRNIADVIWIDGALHHMSDPGNALAAACRIGKISGHIVVREPVSHNLFIQWMRWLRGKTDPAYLPEQVQFSSKEIVSLFLKAGIGNIRVDYFGFFSTPFAQVRLPWQAFFTPVSEIFSYLDMSVSRIFPNWLKRFAFNIIVYGRVERGL